MGGRKNTKEGGGSQLKEGCGQTEDENLKKDEKGERQEIRNREEE